MDIASTLNVLWAEGFTVRLGDGDTLLVRPASTLHDAQRAILRANKTAIVALLKVEQQVTADLIEAAMRVCDRHGDGDAARDEMRADCMALPPHLQADLLDHFSVKSQKLEKGAAT